LSFPDISEGNNVHGTESFVLYVLVATNYLISFTAAQHMNIALKKIFISPSYCSHIVRWNNIAFEYVSCVFVRSAFACCENEPYVKVEPFVTAVFMQNKNKEKTLLVVLIGFPK
jgi:hypothetical protein